MQRDDRGNVQAARQNRGVGRGPAEVGDEAAVAMLLELDHVGRREVVRHQDAVLLLVARRRDVRAAAGQRFEHALDDLHDVGLALAQVLVLDALELIEQRLRLLRHGPLGIASARGDQDRAAPRTACCRPGSSGAD